MCVSLSFSIKRMDLAYVFAVDTTHKMHLKITTRTTTTAILAVTLMVSLGSNVLHVDDTNSTSYYTRGSDSATKSRR
jgi:hypothetical protein